LEKIVRIPKQKGAKFKNLRETRKLWKIKNEKEKIIYKNNHFYFNPFPLLTAAILR